MELEEANKCCKKVFAAGVIFLGGRRRAPKLDHNMATEPLDQGAPMRAQCNPFSFPAIREDVFEIFSRMPLMWLCAGIRQHLCADAFAGSMNDHPNCGYFGDCCVLDKPMDGPIYLVDAQIKNCKTTRYSSAWEFLLEMYRQWKNEAQHVNAKTARFSIYKWLNRAFGVGGRVHRSCVILVTFSLLSFHSSVHRIAAARL